MTDFRELKKNLMTGLKACLAAAGLKMYLDLGRTGTGSRTGWFLTIAVFAVFAFVYRCLDRPEVKTATACKTAVLFSALLSFFTAWGKFLDRYIGMDRPYMAVMAACLFFALYPVGLFTAGLPGRAAADRTPPGPKLEWICFIAIAVVWILGYLAMFPGVYAVDAQTWYREFTDPSFPVLDQWSPIYAGLFFLFVHGGKVWLDSYEAGFAFFTALQLCFVLCAVRSVLHFTAERTGRTGLILAAVFYFLPVHTIIACQSVQAAPFMACYAMLLMHLIRMYEDPARYWGRKRNVIRLGIWGLLCCVLRNNAYIMLAGFIPFIFLYHRGFRKRLVFTVCAVLAVAVLYKGPVLRAFGVQRSNSLREMMSIPLQQMACAYNYNADRLSDAQKEALTGYVPDSNLKEYVLYPSISDSVKFALDTRLIKKDPAAFAGLYLGIGARSLSCYLNATYLQDLGLIYIDKAYPDARMWHPYLNYACYDLHNELYIAMQRHSLFPAYDSLLGRLFGYAADGYGGDVETLFSGIPVFGLLCRVSFYFWIVVYLVLFGLFHRSRGLLFVLGTCMTFTLTILLSPVIVYRYYAPVVFCMPVILSFAGNIPLLRPEPETPESVS